MVFHPAVALDSVPTLSLLLSLILHQEQLGPLLGLELRRPALAAQVVTDPQRVALALVDGQDRLALVRAVGAGDVDLLPRRLPFPLDVPLVGALPDHPR